ncbi:uncharacterized protein LACBIDRAFT_292698 [Laccaria bicolor S238N-H82]|uniref:Predicted protein n=1 Tax=Laccaria bicolor (strain S238N-H82 / ATCC MYA-4686) TaxID=486041 RepID=B0CZQ2_LACBS|nr:uncharacterized protein LACBIDRAFT_292698 [Laccaria bicolor S238N-H82]EDR12657.1 predicted protein [Laccaria bicolor S238N-H82]|eukprot:XP_001876921.1 predicted protein [Laccaria bicolor S238N-H82]
MVYLNEDTEPNLLAVDRPTQSPVVNNKVTVIIPPGWLTTISAVSTQQFISRWDSEDQAMTVNESEHGLLSTNLRVACMERQDTMKTVPDYQTFWIFDETPTPRGTNAILNVHSSKNSSGIDLNDPGNPAPGTTNPGFNDTLDLPRPSSMAEYMTNYHIIFVIDDSSSMRGQRWTEVRLALTELSKEAMQYDADGMEICFLNSQKRKDCIANPADMLDIFDAVQPRGWTYTGAKLKFLLNRCIKRFDDAAGKPEYADIKPVDIIVLTDGAPTDDPAVVIADAIRRLDGAKHHLNAIGIQFVQIGDEDGAAAALQLLKDCPLRRMVDTVPYTKALTRQRLAEVLLGTLHPSIKSAIAEKSSTAVKECPICCSDDIPEYEYPRFPPTNRCQHEPIACRQCLAQHIEAQLFSQAMVLEINCPSHPCPEKLGYDEIKQWAAADCFKRYNSIALRQHLSEDINFRWCLNAKCDHGQTHRLGGLYQSISFLEDILTQALRNVDEYPIVQCTWCYKKSCFTHQLPWHEGLTCAQFDSLRPDVAADQEAAQLLIGTTTQQCSKCKKRVVAVINSRRSLIQFSQSVLLNCARRITCNVIALLGKFRHFGPCSHLRFQIDILHASTIAKFSQCCLGGLIPIFYVVQIALEIWLVCVRITACKRALSSSAHNRLGSSTACSSCIILSLDTFLAGCGPKENIISLHGMKAEESRGRASSNRGEYDGESTGNWEFQICTFAHCSKCLSPSSGFSESPNSNLSYTSTVVSHWFYPQDAQRFLAWGIRAMRGKVRTDDKEGTREGPDNAVYWEDVDFGMTENWTNQVEVHELGSLSTFPTLSPQVSLLTLPQALASLTSLQPHIDAIHVKAEVHNTRNRLTARPTPTHTEGRTNSLSYCRECQHAQELFQVLSESIKKEIAAVDKEGHRDLRLGGLSEVPLERMRETGKSVFDGLTADRSCIKTLPLYILDSNNLQTFYMAFADAKFLPSGTYAIINVEYNRFISFNKEGESFSASEVDYGCAISFLANKKWSIQGPPDVFADIGPHAEEGEDVVSIKNPPKPHQIYSPTQPDLFWSLPNGDDGASLQLSSKYDSRASYWKFRKLEKVDGDPQPPDPMKQFVAAAVKGPTPLDSAIKNTFAVTIPAGWLTTITSVSCGNCVNLVRVRRVVNEALEKEDLISGWDTIDKAMTVDGSDSDSLALPSAEEAYALVIEAFNSSNRARKDPHYKRIEYISEQINAGPKY